MHTWQQERQSDRERGTAGRGVEMIKIDIVMDKFLPSSLSPCQLLSDLRTQHRVALWEMSPSKATGCNSPVNFTARVGVCDPGHDR